MLFIYDICVLYEILRSPCADGDHVYGIVD